MTATRVVVLTHELSSTGASRLALDAFEALAGEVVPWVLSPNGGIGEAQCRRLGRYTPIAAPETAGRKQPGIKTSLLLRRWRPDLIYVNTIEALRILKLLRLPSAPVLLHAHDIDASEVRSVPGLAETIQRVPRRYIAGSDAVRRALTDEFGVADERVRVAPGSVSDALVGGEPVSRLDLNAGPLRVGGAGQIGSGAGTQLWMLMARELLNLMGDGRVRFVWVGAHGFDEACAFREMARKLGLAGHAELVPGIPDAKAHFGSFDLLAMTAWDDPCSVIALESMAVGKPVICFGAGGAGDEVGDAGIVIPGFSPEAMAAAIAQAARRPERLAALAAAGRERVRAGYLASQHVPTIREQILATAAE